MPRPPAAPRRLNLRGADRPGGRVLAVVVPGFFVLKSIQAKRSMSVAPRRGAAGPRQGAGRHGLSFVNAYLQGNPKSVEALELKGRILSDIARDFQTVQEAIRIQTQILALDPERMDARKRLIELNLKAGLYRAAEAAAGLRLPRSTSSAGPTTPRPIA